MCLLSRSRCWSSESGYKISHQWDVCWPQHSFQCNRSPSVSLANFQLKPDVLRRRFLLRVPPVDLDLASGRNRRQCTEKTLQQIALIFMMIFFSKLTPSVIDYYLAVDYQLFDKRRDVKLLPLSIFLVFGPSYNLAVSNNFRWIFTTCKNMYSWCCHSVHMRYPSLFLL